MKELKKYYYLKLHFLNCRTLDLPKGWNDTKKAGMNSQLWLVLDGSAYLKIGEETYIVKEGDFCLIPDNLDVSYGCDEENGFQLWVVQFQSELFAGSLFDWIHVAWVRKILKEERENCITLFEKMNFGHVNHTDFARNIEITGDLYQLLAQHLQKSYLAEKEGDNQLGDTIQYIDNHMNEKITVTQLAKRVSLHPNYFAYLFRMQFGISPSKFIANTKMRHAALLLEKEAATTEWVASEIGMPDVAAFARFFKRHMGMTPKQYQKSMKGER